MHERVIDITGKRFGRLTVLGLSHIDGRRRSIWLCRCDCGNIVKLRKDHFAYQKSKQKSCGCLHRENSSARMYKLHERRRLSVAQ